MRLMSNMTLDTTQRLLLDAEEMTLETDRLEERIRRLELTVAEDTRLVREVPLIQHFNIYHIHFIQYATVDRIFK